MKKLVSVLLLVTMLATLLVPALSVSAADAALHSVALDFSDGKDPFTPPAAKYTTVATAISSINNNPAALIYSLKNQETWNHVTMLFPFVREKVYVISYDVTVIDQLGVDTPNDTRLIPFVNCSVYTDDDVNVSPNLSSTQRFVTFAEGSSDIVKPGVWTHTVATVSIPPESSMWWTPDSFGFYENPDYQREHSTVASSTFAIDNLVIMEQTEFNAAYPSGVAARTDNPSLGYDKIVADFDTTRYTALRSTNPLKGRLSVTLRGDSILTWDRSKSNEQTKETNLYVPFNIEKGKTYRVGFDVAANAAGAGTKFSLAASATSLATDANAALQLFADADKATVVTLADTGWVHVDMTLTATADAKYFVLALDEASIALVDKLYFDNFALSESSAFPTDMPLRTEGIDNVMRETFDKDTGTFHATYWGTNNKLTNTAVVRNGVQENVLNWEATKSGQTWNKIVASYCFVKSKTYVISFDVMLYGVRTADGISTENLNGSQIAVYTMNSKWTKFEAGSNHGTVNVKAGEWTRVSLTINLSEAGSENYMGFCEFPGNSNNGCFYIDNLTIAQKSADCTADTHVDGVWTVTKDASCMEAGSKTLGCAICNETIQTVEIPAGEHLVGNWEVTKEATCTEKGSQHKVCSACNTEVAVEEIAMKDHIAGLWAVTKEATCTEKGSQHKLCSVCNTEVAVEEIAMKDHTPGEWIIETPAAVGVAGKQHKLCTVCNTKVAEEAIPALPEVTDPATNEVTEAPATNQVTEAPATNGVTGEKTNAPAAVEEDGCESRVGNGFWILIAVVSLAGVMLGKKKQTF